MAQRIVLAGGTGFIGAALARRFRERGAEVVVLTRSTPRRRGDGVREVQWDPGPGANQPGNPRGDPTTEPAPWTRELDGARAVINLAGSTIDCVHTPENRRRILDSRLESVRALGAAVRACATPPATWVQASAVGLYGDTERRCAEAAPAGTDFLADVCRQWEAAFAAECPVGLRGVGLRVGVVLGRKGGAFPSLARLTKRFLGGRAGSGRQGISWILLDDLEEIFLRAASDDAMRGAYNACAPEPASNAEFMRTLREVLGRPPAPPVPAWAIRLAAPLVMKTDPSLVLAGQYAVPARLVAENFRFKAPRLVSALTALAD